MCVCVSTRTCRETDFYDSRVIKILHGAREKEKEKERERKQQGDESASID